MISQSLPPDDLPPVETTNLDTELQRQLEQSTRQHFLECCNRSTHNLLKVCEWTISLAEGLTLIIHCRDQKINWQVLSHIGALADQLSEFSPGGRIRVYPPTDNGSPFEIRVDERSVYRDP